MVDVHSEWMGKYHYAKAWQRQYIRKSLVHVIGTNHKQK